MNDLAIIVPNDVKLGTLWRANTSNPNSGPFIINTDELLWLRLLTAGTQSRDHHIPASLHNLRATGFQYLCLRLNITLAQQCFYQTVNSSSVGSKLLNRNGQTEDNGCGIRRYIERGFDVGF